MWSQARGRHAEEVLARGSGSVDAVTELGDVAIHLEDAPLRPQEFDERGEVRFEALAHEAAPAPQEQVLRGLLADRARAAQALAVVGVGQCVLDRGDIEAVMGRKLLVLRRDQRDRQLP
jgi:hypothetical protein